LVHVGAATPHARQVVLPLPHMQQAALGCLVWKRERPYRRGLHAHASGQTPMVLAAGHRRAGLVFLRSYMMMMMALWASGCATQARMPMGMLAHLHSWMAAPPLNCAPVAMGLVWHITRMRMACHTTPARTRAVGITHSVSSLWHIFLHYMRWTLLLLVSGMVLAQIGNGGKAKTIIPLSGTILPRNKIHTLVYCVLVVKHMMVSRVKMIGDDAMM